jgi:REP element-mobilizing transposase RayT
MPQSFASLHVHFVFSTKHHEPLIPPDLASRMYEYLGGTARGMKCPMLIAGGMPDHVHLLVSMGREVSAAEFVKALKAASSRWVHDTFPDRAGFAWQSGYGAFAVSYSQVGAVRTYIENQAKHHKTRGFQDEFRAFLKAHGIEWDERYVWD